MEGLLLAKGLSAGLCPLDTARDTAEFVIVLAL